MEDPLATAGLRPARAPVALVLVGALALGLGLLVYLADRHASPLASHAARAWLGGPLFGAAGGWLPSAVHPFAFSLFTAALREPGAPPAYRACAAWWAVNVAFELGQHPRLSGPIADGLHAAFGRSAWSEPIANYLLRGRFDVADLAAATAGALAAAGVLHLVHRLETAHVR